MGRHQMDLKGNDPTAEILRRVKEIVPDTHAFFFIVGERRLDAAGVREIGALVRHLNDEELVNLLESFVKRLLEERAGLYG